MKKSKKLKYKYLSSTTLSLNLIFEMLKQYQLNSIKGSNEEISKLYSGLSNLVLKYKWAYLSDDQADLIDLIKHKDNLESYALLSEESRFFGLIYQHSEPQVYLKNIENSPTYIVRAICILQSKDKIRLRNHRYMVNKGWVADPYHLILPSNFLKDSLNDLDIDVDIHYDYNTNHALEEHKYEDEINDLKFSMNVLKKYLISKSLYKESILLIKENLDLGLGKNNKPVLFEQLDFNYN
jgi:hypothetical protein